MNTLIDLQTLSAELLDGGAAQLCVHLLHTKLSTEQGDEVTSVIVNAFVYGLLFSYLYLKQTIRDHKVTRNDVAIP